jgi:hypothetical protein
MEAYEKAFSKTAILLRYPSGEQDFMYAPNQDRRLGYHDDSFGWATLATGKKGDDWFYMARIQKAGPKAIDKWKTLPIGGEIRPELWGCLWNENGCAPQGQDFTECIRQTHASWLMDSSVNRKLTDDQRRRAESAAGRLGYQLHVSSYSALIKQNQLHNLSVTIQNRGVAPFYYPWTVQVGIVDATGKVLQSWDTDWKINSILPDQSVRFEFRPPSESSAHKGILAIGVVNPLRGGVPLRFANTSQDQHAPGWLTLVVMQDNSTR